MAYATTDDGFLAPFFTGWLCFHSKSPHVPSSIMESTHFQFHLLVLCSWLLMMDKTHVYDYSVQRGY